MPPKKSESQQPTPAPPAEAAFENVISAILKVPKKKSKKSKSDNHKGKD